MANQKLFSCPVRSLGAYGFQSHEIELNPAPLEPIHRREREGEIDSRFVVGDAKRKETKSRRRQDFPSFIPRQHLPIARYSDY